MKTAPQAESLNIQAYIQTKPQNGGFFVSRGRGSHPKRIIDSFELIFVHSGKLHIREEKKHFAVDEGETLLLWPGHLHAGTAPFEKNLRFYWIHFDMFPALNIRSTCKAGHALGIPQHNKIAKPYRMVEIFRSFLDEQENGTLSPLSSSLYMAQMLCEASITRKEDPVTASDGMSASHATRVEQYIKENFQKDITTSSIARSMKCNPDYLGRVYRKIYGTTITDSIIDQRLKSAINLLLSSDSNITEVAYDSGFSDIGYFRRKFKQSKGMSPVRYRKLYSKMHMNTA